MDAALQYADESLKKDKDVVLTAVKRKMDYALQYADESFKRDKEVCLGCCHTKMEEYSNLQMNP